MAKSYSIRTQVALLTLVPILILSVGLEAFFLHDRFAALNRGLLERGKLIAHQLSVSSEFGVFVQNQLFLQNIAQGVLSQKDVRGVVILDTSSHILAQAGKLSGTLTDAVSQAHFATDELTPQRPIRFSQDSLWIYQPIVAAQINLGEGEAGAQIGAVIVEMDKSRTTTLQNKLLFLAFGLTVLLLTLVLYAVYHASRRLTEPIRQLSLAINLLGAGKLETRVAEQSVVLELNNLEKGINGMAGQLLQERATLQQRIADATLALRDKKDEAEQANNEKSRFLAIATHDLRQPLHALGLYIAELQRKVKREDLQHLVGQVEHSVESLSVLLNALLDISKLDAGAVVPKIQPYELSELLARFSVDYQLLAHIKNIHVVVHCPPIYVLTDAILLERILMNLVSNAIRYTPSGGCVMLACRKRGGKIRIEVRDNGTGIAQQNLENIFREFFQITPSGLDVQKSLGLGLSIVQRLAKLLGHMLLVRSELGRGSVFSLIVPLSTMPNLPYLSKPTVLQDAVPWGATPLTGKSFLVVDDDELVLEGTAILLEAWGCQVTRATTLAQVQQFVAQGLSWDLVISDYQLGEQQTGLDVIATLHQTGHGNIPCILISGDTSAALLNLTNDSGYRLLHKPVQPAKLRSLVLFLLQPKQQPEEGAMIVD